MNIKIGILLIISGLNYGFISAQTPLDQKYDFYKQRLNSKFCVVGPGAGQSIPLSGRRAVFGSDSLNHWGDATIELGWYIGVLASEYEVKRLKNENYTQTVKELYYAINALNRLDTLAEIVYGGTASLNGFLIRDDVSSAFIAQTNLNNPVFFGTDTCLISNHSIGCHCVSVSSCPPSFNNEESQDQFYHMLLGLSFCAKYANVTYNGVNLATEAKAITNRLITHLKNGNWFLRNSVTQNNVTRGENATAYAYGIAKAGLNITGINYSDVLTNGPTATLLWNSFPTLTTMPNSFLDNVHMFLATASVANDDRPSVDNFAVVYDMPIYPLIRQVLYGGTNTINDDVYHNLLDAMDANGNFYYSPTYKSNGTTWLCENIFIWPDRNKRNAEGTNTLQFTFAEYNALDFMLLRNLMELKVHQLVSIEDKEHVDITVYPNPNHGTFVVDGNLKGNANLKLTNQLGQIVLDLELPSNLKTHQISMQELSNGIYFYNLYSKNKLLKTGKIIYVK